jgi:hypothetical protein
MEPLWSPVVATAGSRWQMRTAPEAAKSREIVAVGCHRYGKEGVSGSSPEEGFEKFLQFSSFCLRMGLRLGVPTSTERPRLAADASCEAWNSWR